MEAESLNLKIKKDNPEIFSMLSEKGKAIFFPRSGIISQSAEAKGKKYNATAGIALDENSSPLTLRSLKVDPKHALYAPSFGVTELRKRWLNLIRKKNPSLKSRTSLPVVTSGLTHGISIASYLFIDKDEKVIIPNLFWGNYSLIFKQRYNAKLNTFRLFKEGSFDMDCLANKLKEDKTKKKILLLNFPNNPSGYTPTEKEAEEITALIRQRADKGEKLVILLDDAYFGLVYKKGVFKESLFSKLADLHKNVLAVKLDAATKEEYAWGLRVGFITFASKGITAKTCAALESKAAGAIRNSISNASNLSQHLLLQAFMSKTYNKEKRQNFLLLKSRFEKIQDILKDKKYDEFFTALPHNSGYFMCIQLKEGLDAEKIRKTLLKSYNTGVIATHDMIRIAYSSIPVKDLKTIFDNIYKACR